MMRSSGTGVRGKSHRVVLWEIGLLGESSPISTKLALGSNVTGGSQPQGAGLRPFLSHTDIFCQVMRLGFRCDESVYTSVRGRQERPRGPPMAHMDSTNIYSPCRVRVIRF